MSRNKENVYWVERDSIGLALYDPVGSEKNNFKSLASAQTVTLFYYKKADHFNTLNEAGMVMSEQSDLPPQFHQHLVEKAIQLGYETKPDMIQMAPYFASKFEKGIKEAKMYSNRGRISGIRTVQQHDY